MTDFLHTAPNSAPLRGIEVDTRSPAAARAYDFYLGGDSNFEVDRDFGRKVLEKVPFVADFARSNRAFLHRAVKGLCAQGIDQFLDIGSGIPTAGNVHEVAQHNDPRARTVYVDHESIAVRYAQAILNATDPRRERTDVIQADLRAPEEVLNSPAARNLLDFSRPIALLVVATMHFIGPGDRPVELLARYREALAPGSFLVLSHLTMDGVPERMRRQGRALESLYAATPNPGYFRDRDEFTALFDGLDLVEPGVVWAPEWCPSHDATKEPAATATIAGVGRKR